MIRPLNALLIALTALLLAGCCCGCCCRTASAAPKAAAPQANTAELLQGKWTLVKLPAAEAKKVKLPNGIFIQFEKARVFGFAGVNRFFGEFTAKGASLQFNRMGVTRMAGPDLPAEDLFVAALNDTRACQIANGTLSLANAKGEILATFKTAPKTK